MIRAARRGGSKDTKEGMMYIITDQMTHHQIALQFWSELWPYLIVLVIMIGVHEVLSKWEKNRKAEDE